MVGRGGGAGPAAAGGVLLLAASCSTMFARADTGLVGCGDTISGPVVFGDPSEPPSSSLSDPLVPFCGVVVLDARMLSWRATPRPPARDSLPVIVRDGPTRPLDDVLDEMEVCLVLLGAGIGGGPIDVLAAPPTDCLGFPLTDGTLPGTFDGVAVREVAVLDVAVTGLVGDLVGD